MSRLARKPVPLGKAKASIASGVLTVSGPSGSLERRLHPAVVLTVEGDGVSVSPKDQSRIAKALTGTFASHVKNMVQGVSAPYTKKLILEGVGFRVELKGKELSFSVGFSHPVVLAIPGDVAVTVEKNAITLTSADKEALGQFAANIRKIKPPEPYLGKGIRYDGEVVRRKQGKKAA